MERNHLNWEQPHLKQPDSMGPHAAFVIAYTRSPCKSRACHFIESVGCGEPRTYGGGIDFWLRSLIGILALFAEGF